MARVDSSIGRLMRCTLASVLALLASGPDAEEWFGAPGLHLRIHELAGFTAEYVRWQFDSRRVVDRIEWIVHGYF